MSCKMDHSAEIIHQYEWPSSSDKLYPSYNQQSRQHGPGAADKHGEILLFLQIQLMLDYLCGELNVNVPSFLPRF